MTSSIQTLQCRLSGIYRLATSCRQQMCITRCAPQVAIHSRNTVLRNEVPFTVCLAGMRDFHTSQSNSRWEDKNRTVYPPQKPGEPRRPAEIYFSKRQIKHSHRKLWYIATFVKGMMIEDALTQLPLLKKKAALIVRDVLLEAQEEAMKNHNVEYKSNLHIAESIAGKGQNDHAVRYHGRGYRFMLDLSYCHYFVCLREGPPPEQPVFTGYDHAEKYMKRLRGRYIQGGL